MADSEKEQETEAAEVLRKVDLSDGEAPVIMGETPDWFTNADAHILFVLYTGLTLTPSVIAENTGVSRVTVSRQLKTLQAGGLVEKVERGKYKITNEGAFVVSGDPEIYTQD